MNFLAKLLFLIRRPILIVVLGNGRACAAEAVFQVLKRSPAKARCLILQDVPGRFLLKRAKRVILAVSAAGEIPADEILFSGEKAALAKAAALIKALAKESPLILNVDDEAVRELKDECALPVLTFGLRGEADFQASDIHIAEQGTNFKLNYKGNIVPIWLQGLFGKEQVYSGLTAVAAAVVLGINLVEASQRLNSYRSLPGHMRLIKGIKKTRILDDSANASPFSMIEALGILAKIPCPGRRIAVLGDVLGIGKYTMQSHEALGEKAAGCCDLLFTVGARAKFMAEGAIEQGFSREKIFQFIEPEEAGLALQKELAEHDLVLIDGSSEMAMQKMVKEVEGIN